MTPDQIVIVLASILGPAGAAWAGVKISLNGTVARVNRIEDKVDKVVVDVAYLKGQGDRQEAKEEPKAPQR